jgi:hypothetical protein
MKTNPHTKPQSHEGNPSQRSAPTLVFPRFPIRVHPFPFAGRRFPLRASAPLREISLCVASFAPAHFALRAAFGRLPGQRPLARVPVSAFRSPVSSSPTHSPAEAQSCREIPQGAWASRPPSTHGRDGSPQPSQTSGATRRHEGRLRLKNGASRRSAPTLVSLPIRVHTSPFAGQRFPLRELVSFEHALDHRMAKKTPANLANPRE